MADEIKELKTSIETSLSLLKKNWEDRQAIEDKTGKELGEKIGETHKIVDGLKTNVDKFEAKQKELEEKAKELETAIARMGTQGDGEKGVKPEELKKFNEMLKGHNNGMKQVAVDDAKSIAELEEKYIRRGSAMLEDAEKKSLNTISDPEGGYFVMPQWGAMSAEKGFDENGILKVVSRQATNTGIFKDIIDYADYDLSYFQEQGAENVTTQAGEGFKMFELVTSTQKYGKKFSREFLEDTATDIQGKVIRRMQAGMERTKAAQLVNGTISQGKSRGILTYANGTTYGTIEQVSSTTNDVVGWDDMFKTLPSKLKEKYRANASYLMNKGTFFGLLTEKDSVGRYQVGDQINFFSGDKMSISILGTPVVWEPNMPVVANGSLSVAYGDFAEAYVLAERLGYSIIRDETHPDYILLWIRNRHVGGVFNFEAIKLLATQ